MKLHRIIFITLLVLSFFCLFSCAGTPDKRTDSLYIMVYDFNNSELMNVSIYIDGKEIGKTDIYGRLMYPCENEKEVFIRAEKQSYETIEENTAVKPGIVIYIKMGNGSYYAQQAEKLLDENNLSSSLEVIDKALEINDRKDWRFLKSVIIRRLENAE